MAPSQYTRYVLAERPKGAIDDKTFRKEVLPLDLKAGPGQVLVKVQYLSIDPGLRLRLNEKMNHSPPLPLGSVIWAFGLGVVTELGEGSNLAIGDVVSGAFGWTEYIVTDAQSVTKLEVPEGAQVLDFLGPLGHIGLTAFAGLLDVAQIQPGEVLLVSGASGAVGSLVCQLGKERRAKVYGLSGSSEKCAWLEREIGVDKAFNYKSPTFEQDFTASVGGFDVFFDNVGGKILDFALSKMNLHARIIICGYVADYNTESPTPITNFPYLLLKRATVKTISLFDFQHRAAEARAFMTELLNRGSVKQKYHILEGLDAAPKAVDILFSGEKNGKMVLKL